MTHPAFLAFNTTGLWVGKFDTGYKNASYVGGAQQNNNNSINIVIKPEQFSWRYITIANSYTASLNYKKELLSHNMKNTEWGAVAYLTQSIYGKCTNNGGITCSEVMINNNGSYKTGYASISIPYTDPSSVAASTTNNYSGIYDMSGGAIEQQVSVMLDTKNETPMYSSSGLTAQILTDPRLYDVYKYNGEDTHWERRILGDATGEVGPFGIDRGYKIDSYFGDYSQFVNSTKSWFYRGGDYGCTTFAGIFAFDGNIQTSGGENGHSGFRIVLAP